jgi:transposase
VRGNKNDHNDAFAIAEASQRANIRFVPVKSEHQQEIFCLHRIRIRLIKNRTALSNQSRGLLSEFGVVFPCGHKALLGGLNSVITNPQYSHRLQNLVIDMLIEYKTTLKRLKRVEQQLRIFVEDSESGRILIGIPGIGIINATAFLASIDKGQAFNRQKKFAVWLGLTPKQQASCNISKMGGITKRDDRYTRKRSIHGSRAFVSRTAKSTDPLSLWATKLRITKLFDKSHIA